VKIKDTKMKKLIILSILFSTIIPSDFTNNGAIVTIQEGVIVTMIGSFENNGEVNNFGSISVSGNFTNTGDCNFDPQSQFTLNGEDQYFPSLTYGDFTIDGSGTKSMSGDCLVNGFALNSGILAINEHALTIDGVITYDGGYISGEGSVLHQGVEVYGCTDDTATNYSPDYIFDSGDCEYGEAGCNDETAYNFNENAQWNDGTCIYYGDINADGSIDVVDVIAMVGFVLEFVEPTPEEILLGDLYPDGVINIYDIVSVVSIIMSDSLLDTLPLSEVTLIQENNSLKFSKTGSIAGIQIEYEGDFESSIEGWMIEKNENTIIMVSIDGSDINKLHYSGDLKIISCSVVDWELNKIQAEITVIPDQFSLKPAYPNPFNPVTTINYAIPYDAYVVIKAFDVRGKEVADLVNGMIEEGIHEVVWDASKLSSGMYFVRMTSGEFKAVQKIVFVK
jgi:hypothetical protein